MKSINNLKICLAGKNEIALYGLKLLLKKIDKDNIYILTNSTDFGFDTWQPSLLKFAKENKLNLINIEECYSLKNIIFISLEYDKLINPNKFLSDRLYNIHFSKLPYYKGMFTSAWPLINNETESGVTLHRIDNGIDTGDIIDQITFNIKNINTSKELYYLYLNFSKKLIHKNLDNILKNKIKSRPQPFAGSSYYSKKSIDYKNLKINFFDTAETIKNKVRAFTFPEYQVPKIKDYYINFASIINSKSKKKPGSILFINSKKIVISTVDYDISLKRDKNFELFHSASKNNIKEVRECIKSGANINVRLGNGWTPIITASFHGAIDTLKILIDNGADINLTNYKGTTPLMYAMHYYENTGDKKVFKMLIKNGACLHKRDLKNKSLQDYMKERNVKKTIFV